jgi:hypothetical protein
LEDSNIQFGKDIIDSIKQDLKQAGFELSSPYGLKENRESGEKSSPIVYQKLCILGKEILAKSTLMRTQEEITSNNSTLFILLGTNIELEKLKLDPQVFSA